MKPKHRPWILHLLCQRPGSTLVIQAPLPFCLDTLPRLHAINGQGSGRQGPSPLASAEEPAND